MRQKNYQAPLALALAALFAATLVPVSGADGEGAFYVSITEPDAPAWRMTKLLVTEEGVHPTLKLQFTNAVCPLTWGFKFLVGTPDGASVYNGASFTLGGGAGGVTTTIGDVTIERDRESACASLDVWTIGFDELPLGTVYLLETRSGADFDGWARISLSGPGVEQVASSMGYESQLVSSDAFEGGVHVAAANPGMCLSPRADGGCDWAWSGGARANADAGAERSTRARFQHHPWFSLQHIQDSAIGNASVTDPAGRVVYMAGSESIGGLSLNQRGFTTPSTDFAPGEYTFEINLNVDANPSSWWATWWDIQFPEEQPDT